MPDQPALADTLAKHMCEIDACTDPAPCFDHLTVAGVALKFLGNTVDAAYQRGLAEGRAQATVGWEWAGLSLGYEDEQWSVWWREAPGHGLNVTVPTEGEADHEAVVRAFQAEHGGEIKRRRRVSLVGPWEPAERPKACASRIAHESGVVLACTVDHGEPRSGLHANVHHQVMWDESDDRVLLETLPATGGVVEPSGPPTTEETSLATGGIVEDGGLALVAEDGCTLTVPIRPRPRMTDGCGPEHTYRGTCAYANEEADRG